MARATQELGKSAGDAPAPPSSPGWREKGRRVTVFSLSGCPHCLRAKRLLGDLGHPFEEVSLSDYPEKRADMLALADRS
eukprot:gene42485-38177_t